MLRLVGGVANLVLALTMIKALADLLANWLGARHQERFVAFLQRAVDALSQPNGDSLLVPPLLALSKVYERLLGPRPFSRQALWRTCVLASFFLGALLGITGLFCGKPFAMNLLPWRSFFAALDYLQILGKEPSFRQRGDPWFIGQNAADLARFHNWPCAIAFTVYFAVVVVVATALLVSLTTAVSRLFLQEMVAATSRFRLFLLFVSNTVVLVGFAGIASLALFILLNVWTWPFVPMLFALSEMSIALGVVLASAASLGSWFVSAPWLRVVVVLSVLPSLLMAAVLGLRLVGVPLRRRLLLAAADLIRRSIQSPKGVFSFISSSSAALAFLLTVVASFLGWLARVSLTLGAPKIFGVDFLSFSLFAVVLMMMLSFARASDGPTKIGPAQVLFLFGCGLTLVIFGFYIQAILECFINIESAGGPASRLWTLASPGLGALIPGAVVGAVAVFSRASYCDWLRLSLRVLIVLALSDAFNGLRGLASYRDTVFSIGCDILGAPVAALLIVQLRQLFFPISTALETPSPSAEQVPAESKPEFPL